MNQQSINQEYPLSKRVQEILNHYPISTAPLDDTLQFVKEVLNPIPERYDMFYRYAHTMRVRKNGAQIAREEGLNEEALTIACLLHDVGYPECKTIEELRQHPAISAVIANAFLTRIGYDEDIVETICHAIEIHNLMELPSGLTPFEISVRDADDIDCFGMIRTVIKVNSLIGENDTDTILSGCNKEKEKMSYIASLPRGTETASRMMQHCISEWLHILDTLIAQLESAKQPVLIVLNS